MRNFFTKPMLGGIAFTASIALVGLLVAKLPGFDHIGALASAILIAILYRQFFGYPEYVRSGVQFSSKILLRVAIVLFGLKLNLEIVFHQGLGLLGLDIITIIFGILVTLLFAKWLKADMTLALLVGVGTGVCGAAAIAAVSPIVKAKEEDTALGVGIIALTGTIFAIAYTVIRPWLPLSAINYGVWSGISLHEIAHVALAAAPGGDDSLALALLAKLGRVLLLIPLSFVLMYWMQRKNKQSGEESAKVSFPWFLVGFIIMSFLGSFVIDKSIMISDSVLSFVSTFTTFLLAMAMSGLGLSVSFKEIRTKTARPFLAMLLASILLSLVTFVEAFFY